MLEKSAEIQMIEVWIPAVDQRWLILPLHATIGRHQAGHREVETGAAESAAAATHCANENNEIEVQTVR